jgi:hypothetical protein
LIATAIAIPFARRDDLFGWLSLAVVAGFAIVLWASMAIGATRAFLAWRADRPIESDDPRVGECYTDCIYKISWDHDCFSLRTHSGEPVVQVPLSDILRVIDLDALLLHDDVTVSTPRKHVPFPESAFGNGCRPRPHYVL